MQDQDRRVPQKVEERRQVVDDRRVQHQPVVSSVRLNPLEQKAWLEEAPAQAAQVQGPPCGAVASAQAAEASASGMVRAEAAPGETSAAQLGKQAPTSLTSPSAPGSQRKHLCTYWIGQQKFSNSQSNMSGFV